MVSYHAVSQKRNVVDRTELDLFRSRGTKHDGVFSANEHFILYAHAEAMKVLGELRIGRYVYALIKTNDGSVRITHQRHGGGGKVS
jgi:hypothetical protein